MAHPPSVGVDPGGQGPAQTLGVGPMHLPPRQESFCVHGLPSLHVVPLALAGLEHWPDVVSQEPTLWHWSDAVQVTGLAPVHVPDWQASVWVQALPSLHDVPFALAGLEHWPVAESQVPASWHWSDAEQVTGLVPVQLPA